MPCTEFTSLRRFFVSLPERIETFPAVVSLGDELLVRHIRSVLRLNKGAEVALVDKTSAQVYLACIESVEKTAIAFRLDEVCPQPEASLPEVILAAALIKEQRWDWLLQKTTELGVRTLVPLTTDRTVIQVKDPEKKQERWQAIVQSAAEQSEGIYVPQVEVPMTLAALDRWLAENETEETPIHRMVLQERDAQGKRCPLREIMTDLVQKPGRFCFLVGPEGGWSPAEIEFMAQAGFQPVSLGGRILRSETAAVSLMGALAYEYDSRL